MALSLLLGRTPLVGANTNDVGQRWLETELVSTLEPLERYT